MRLPKFLILTLLTGVALLAACQDASPSRQSTPSLPPAATFTPALTPTLCPKGYDPYPPPGCVPVATLAQAYPEPRPAAESTSAIPPALQSSSTPGKQLYIDPDGRYQVELPADWHSGDQAGTYAGPNGYFRAGSLPEMGFYSRADEVCMRLVQTLGEPAAPQLLMLSSTIDSCQVVPLPYQSAPWARIVIRAPGMPPEKRYFYFETDAGHNAAIVASLKMLVPISRDDFYAFPSGLLRPADQVFWDIPRQPAPGITLTETRLAAPASDNPAKNDQFPSYVPRELWLASWGPNPAATPDPLIAANQVLARFGFELRQTPTDENGPYVLYQAGKRLREQITSRENPILSTSGQDFALPLVSRNGYEILRRNGLEQWEKLGGPEAPYRFLGDALLAPYWNSSTQSIDVRKDNQSIFQFATVFEADFGLHTFQVWQNHWLLEVRGFLIQDGVILNDTLGYEEIYNWQLLNGKPFYFFRKGPRVGISYDGQVQPAYYDEVAHYMCCGFAGANPYNNESMIHFFALREGVWYFVTIGE
jgi:hypothetical protein